MEDNLGRMNSGKMAAEVVQAVSQALADGFQVDPEAFVLLDLLVGKLNLTELLRRVMQAKKEGNSPEFVIITKEDLEAGFPPNFEVTDSGGEVCDTKVDLEVSIEILNDPTSKLNPIEGIQGFHDLFKSRFNKLLNIAKQRPDSRYLTKIGDIKNRSGKYKVAGLILGKSVKKGRFEVTIDDDTGKLDITILGDRIKKNISELLLDQFAIADIEFSKRGDVYGKSIYPADVPDRVLNLSKERVYVLLLSDLHLGSRMFLNDSFKRLISWLTCKMGEEDIIHRIKYIVIAGDVVDGVGIYPNQEMDLEESDIFQQFINLSRLLEQIPKHMKIFIIPGNHDPARQSLPQPSISREYAEPLYRLENLTLLGNPTSLLLNGVNVLVFHGKSIDDVVGTTPGLSMSRPALSMKILLRSRHLAPIYGGRTPIAPEPEDHLVIEEVPEIFHAGHVHVLDSERYKGTLIVNSGTWQSQTSYQSNMGIEPTPGIVPIVDLSTLNVMVRNFTRPLI